MRKSGKISKLYRFHANYREADQTFLGRAADASAGADECQPVEHHHRRRTIQRRGVEGEDPASSHAGGNGIGHVCSSRPGSVLMWHVCLRFQCQREGGAWARRQTMYECKEVGSP